MRAEMKKQRDKLSQGGVFSLLLSMGILGTEISGTRKLTFCWIKGNSTCAKFNFVDWCQFPLHCTVDF
ncbi:hypothetical protein SLEP1_g35586 [Rubroshorea leprosula]|uniref:Uncharacterized protein n=1 Tax=Rubroshorea leprosula TaxID=152421 RepID=A0AAV5KNY0_9ROSI|nr:hypothetical protein SLEP1_g35586 [Rubroshorea leprosula]